MKNRNFVVGDYIKLKDDTDTWQHEKKYTGSHRVLYISESEYDCDGVPLMILDIDNEFVCLDNDFDISQHSLSQYFYEFDTKAMRKDKLNVLIE